MSITYAEAPGESEESVAFALYMPGETEPFWQAQPPLSFRAQPVDLTHAEGGFDQPIIVTTMNTGFSPFIVPRPGIVRVVAHRGDDQINLGTLQFALTDEHGNAKAD